jgi:predicted secreted protein
VLSTLSATVGAQGQEPGDSAVRNVVHLSAVATVELVRDQLGVSLSTSREGQDAGQVQAQLRQALEAALAEARKAARPGQLQVQTGSFSLHPRTGSKGQIVGWTGSAELLIEGRDVAAVSQLAGRLGTLSVQRVVFSLSREAREKVESEVRTQAIERFRAQADEVARSFGFGGWALREVHVNAGESSPGLPPPRAMAMRAAGSEDAALPVEPGRSQVSVTVNGAVQLLRP